MRRSFLLVSLVGCSSSGGDVTIDVTHDVCSPISVMSSRSTEAQTTGIDEALAMWRAHGVRSLSRSDAAMIDIRFEDAAANFFGVYDDEKGIVFINSKITDPHELSIVIAHELGHSFGLDHVTGRPSLMNPGNTKIELTAEDQAMLESLWGPCPSPTLPTSASEPPGS